MSTITCTDILHTNAQSNQNKQKTNWKEKFIQFLQPFRLFCCLVVSKWKVSALLDLSITNPWHHNISMQTLHTNLYTFVKMLTRRKFLYSHDPSVWFAGDIVRRTKRLVTLRDQMATHAVQVKFSCMVHWTFKLFFVV